MLNGFAVTHKKIARKIVSPIFMTNEAVVIAAYSSSFAEDKYFTNAFCKMPIRPSSINEAMVRNKTHAPNSAFVNIFRSKIRLPKPKTSTENFSKNEKIPERIQLLVFALFSNVYE